MSELFNIAKIVENWASRIKKRVLDAAKSGVELDGLKVRSMGRTRKVIDNQTFTNIAQVHGLDASDILEAANIPLAKVAKLIAAKAPKGEKREKELNFIDDCQQAGIIRASDERFTIAKQ